MTHNDLEDLESQLGEQRRKVDVASISFSAREIVRMLVEGELSIAPTYQRKYRWPDTVASAFIESIFLGLPIPPIFVATNADYEWEVVDGLQRVSTLLRFMSENTEDLELINKTSTLKLKELQKLSQLNGLAYSDLPVSIQRYFGRQPLQVISLTDKSDRSVRFDLFERLNTGSVTLTPQEVRAAVYRGEFMDFVTQLATFESFASLLKLQESNQGDGTASEQVLKFFAYKNSQDEFRGGVKSFLNKYTENASVEFDYEMERDLFEKTFIFLESVVEGPFLRTQTSVTPLVEFEAVGVAIARIFQSGISPSNPPIGWIEDSELVDASTGGTNTRSMLGRRLSRASELFRGE